MKKCLDRFTLDDGLNIKLDTKLEYSKIVYDKNLKLKFNKFT